MANRRRMLRAGSGAPGSRRLTLLLVLALAGLTGCAGQGIVPDVLNRRKVYSFDLGTGAFPDDQALLRLGYTPAEIREFTAPAAPPSTLKLGARGSDQLTLYHVAGADGRRVVVAAAVERDSSDAHLPCFWSLQPGDCDEQIKKNEAVGWMEPFGMLHVASDDGGLYVGCTAWSGCSRLLRVWDFERLVRHWGPFEPLSDLMRRWQGAVPTGLEAIGPDEQAKLRSIRTYLPEVDALRLALRRREETVARRTKIAIGYDVIRREGLNYEGGNGIQLGDLIKEEAASLADTRPVTAAALDVLGRYLARDTTIEGDGWKKLIELAPSYVEIASEDKLWRAQEPKELDPTVYARSRLDSSEFQKSGEHVRARLWNYLVSSVRAPKDRPGAIVVSIPPARTELRRTFKHQRREAEVPYDVEVFGALPENADRVAALRERLGEIEGELAAQGGRLEVGGADQAARGLINDSSKTDPMKSPSPAWQGGGLSGSADWRIQDAKQRLRELERERDRLTPELESLSTPGKHTVTRTRTEQVDQAVSVWSGTVVRAIVARAPDGSTGTADEQLTPEVADSTGQLSAVEVERSLDERSPASSATIWKALAPALAPRIEKASAWVTDPREKALIRFFFGFQELPGPWPEFVLGDLVKPK